MMKQVLLTTILFCCLKLSAQIERVQYQGKSYYVYPHDEKTPKALETLFTKRKYLRYEIKGANGNLKDTLHKNKDYNTFRKNEKIRKEDKVLLKTAPWFRYEFSEYESEYRKIPPYVEKIPDGTYIQYFKHIPFLNKDTVILRDDVVAAIFSIRNNLPEGPAIWFSPGGDTIQSGFYRNGQANGKWTFLKFKTTIGKKAKTKDILAKKHTKLIQKTEIEYLNGIENGTKTFYYFYSKNEGGGFSTSSYTYQNGIKNGPYTMRINNVLFEKGQYKNDRKSGEWFYYHPKNGQHSIYKIREQVCDTSPMQLIKHFTYADSLVLRKEPIIRNLLVPAFNHNLNFKGNNVEYKKPNQYNFNENYIHSTGELYRIPNGFSSMDLIDSRKKYDSLPGTSLDFYFQLQIKGDSNLASKRYTRQEVIDSFAYQFIYDGIYEEYYPNGQLRVKFEIKDGTLLEEDTLFYENGNIQNVLVYLPEKESYEEKIFGYDGNLLVHRSYDPKGNLRDVEFDPNHATVYSFSKNGQLYNESFKYYEYKNYSRKPYLEKTIVEEVLHKKDSSIRLLKTFDPLTRTYYKRLNYEDNSGFEELEISFDTNYLNYRGKLFIQVGALSKTYEIQDSLERRNSNPFNKQLNFQNISLYQNTENDVKATWNLHGKPYSGKIILSEIEDTVFTIREYPKKLKIIYNGEMDFDPDYLLGPCSSFNHAYTLRKPLLRFFDGNNLNFNNYREKVKTISLNFQLGILNGKALFRTEKGKKIHQTQFDQGSISGTSYSRLLPIFYTRRYSFRDLSKIRKIKKYTYGIDSIQNGVKHGTSIRFDVNGDTIELNQYNHGKLHGKSLDYNFFTKSYHFYTYTNDTLNGPWYELGLRKDTIAKGTFNMGTRVGKEYSFYDGKKAEVSYQQGKLNGPYLIYYQEQNEPKGLFVNAEIKDNFMTGLCEVFYENQSPMMIARFNSGYLTDSVIFYSPNGDIDKRIKLQDSLVKSIEIWHDGLLNRRLETSPKDSLLYALEYTDKFYISFGFDGKLIVERDADKSPKQYISLHRSPLLLTRFYPDGNIKAQGKINKGIKIGWWTTYHPDGSIAYRIDYQDSSVTLNDSLSFEYSGIYQHYNATGEIIAKSYIIENRNKFNCSDNEDFEIPTLYTFWEKDNSVGRMNGFVKNYYDNGTLQSEGLMQNGLPTGTWKYYDPFGKLYQIGLYRNGKREGRWIIGDLSEIAYIGDICFDPDLVDLEQQVKKLERILKLELSYYEAGKKIRTEQFTIDKN